MLGLFYNRYRENNAVPWMGWEHPGKATLHPKVCQYVRKPAFGDLKPVF
jgi:hypothetical protein